MDNSPSKDTEASQKPQRPFTKLYKGDPCNRIQQVLGPRGKLFMFLLMEMNDHNVVKSSHKDLARKVVVSRVSVSRYLQDFERMDICVTGRNQVFMNPDVLWVGTENQQFETARRLYKHKRTQKGLMINE